MRSGGAWRLPDDVKSGHVVHTLPNVYSEMMIQIAMDLPGVSSNLDSMPLSKIRFWYEGIRPTVERRTAPKKK